MLNHGKDIPRDLTGYGENSHHPQWPNDAKIAVSFVLNYEEGGEYSVLNGDQHSETYLKEGGVGGEPRVGYRNINIESEYDYGSRAGVWRIFRLFNKHDIQITVYAVGKALEENAAVARSAVEHGHDVGSHGYRLVESSCLCKIMGLQTLMLVDGLIIMICRLKKKRLKSESALLSSRNSVAIPHEAGTLVVYLRAHKH